MDFLHNRCTVRMRDSNEVHEKLKKFINDKADHLLVVTDFDYTLSKSKNHIGEQCCISYGVFEAIASNISLEYARYFTEMNDRYLPIELSAEMSREEKAPHMMEWWQKSNDHILKAKFTQEDLENFVAKSSIELRDHADMMIYELNRNSIPLMIFSAGIGNIIDICLRRKFGTIPSNVHIVSNMMLFDEQGISNGFSEPIIHTFCKDGSAIEKCESLRQEITGRCNVLLLGDSLGDLHMTDGYRANGDDVTVLKVGFLNREFDTHYDHFIKGYDIVLIDDQTMDVPRYIIQRVLQTSATSTN